VTDSSDNVSATINLAGNYSVSGWSVTSDGDGGIDVVDPPPITVNDGALVEIGAASAGAAMFGGASGTLQLDNAQSFSGLISGFGGQDQLDLRDIASSASATIGYVATGDNSGGTLTVSDGTHTANIALLGQYAAASFAAAGDGHGGTMITNIMLAAQDQLAHA
jgi:hypothetical protein